MLTAKGQAYDREAGSDAGADRWLTKPIDPDELLRMAREALGMTAAADARNRPRPVIAAG